MRACVCGTGVCGNAAPVKAESASKRNNEEGAALRAGHLQAWGVFGAWWGPHCVQGRGDAAGASCSGERPQPGLQLGAPTRAGSETWINKLTGISGLRTLPKGARGGCGGPAGTCRELKERCCHPETWLLEDPETIGVQNLGDSQGSSLREKRMDSPGEGVLLVMGAEKLCQGGRD